MTTPTIETVDRQDEVQLLIPEVRRQTRRRRMVRWARVLAVVAAVALVASSLFLATRDSFGRTSRHQPGGGSTGLGEAISIPRAPTLEIYGYPVHLGLPDDGISAFRFYFRRVGSSSPPRSLGNGVWASLTPSAGTAAYMGIASSESSDSAVYRVGSENVSQRFRVAPNDLGELGSMLLATPSSVYVQNDSPGQIVKFNVRTRQADGGFNVPATPYTPPRFSRALDFPGPKVGTVAALMLDSRKLYALTYNLTTVGIDDLSTGAHHVLRGFGEVGDAVVASNGDIYAMAWRVNHSSTMSVLRIDPSTLDVVSTMSAGVRPSSFDNVQMQALPTGGVLAFIAAQRQNQLAASPMYSYLWRVSASRLHPIALPANVGLDMRAFGNGVYFFGGPATNVVSRLNLTNMSLKRDVPGLSSPSGTYLYGLT